MTLHRMAGFLAIVATTALLNSVQAQVQTMPQMPPQRNLEQIPPPPPVFQPALPAAAVVPTGPVVVEALKPIPPRDFVKSFVPVPGKYDVLFQHPVSGQPVNVLFQLPEGTPRKVRYVGHQLLFDYGRHEVEIHFRLGGKVTVSQR